MVEWLKRLVAGEGNVMQERSYTNWNTLDAAAIVAEKIAELQRQVVSEPPKPPAPSAPRPATK